MNTEYALLARFESPTVPLSEIAKEFFGITPKTAEQQAKAGALPVPVFKLRESERSTTLVHINDLAMHIDRQVLASREIWQSANPQIVS